MRKYILILAALVVVGGVALVIFSDDGPDIDPWVACVLPSRTELAAPTEVDPLSSVATEVVAEIPAALAMDTLPGTDIYYVATKTGQVVRVDGATQQDVIDLSEEVSATLEQGLLGLAIAPDGRHLYVDYTDLEDHTHIDEYELDDTGMPMLDTRRELLFVEQPFHTHNGGHLEFTSDGLLWISLGDGAGSTKGPDFGNGPAAQDLSNLYGTILRIDPRPSDGMPYSIPPDNPFVNVATARDEIWTYGLRNPWRFSIDEVTGDLWIGDVGQSCWEELNHLRAADGAGAGANLGWNMVEGPDDYAGGELGDVVWPAHAPSRADGFLSIAGGVVYRGASLPELQGWYLFGDTYTGEMFAMRPEGGGYELRSLGFTLAQPASFAVDEAGEVYVLSLIDGLLKLVPAA